MVKDSVFELGRELKLIICVSYRARIRGLKVLIRVWRSM